MGAMRHHARVSKAILGPVAVLPRTCSEGTATSADAVTIGPTYL